MAANGDIGADVVLAHRNAHVDISGLAYPDVVRHCGQDVILQDPEAVAKREPEKVLFGTDRPICDVGEHLRLVAGLRISDEAKELILSGNAARVFGLSASR